MDWLAINTTVVNHTRWLGNALADDVLGELDGLPRDRRVPRSTMVDHFWCDLLAASAQAIADLEKLPGEVADTVASAIFDEREARRRAPVERMVLSLAANSTSKAI